MIKIRSLCRPGYILSQIATRLTPQRRRTSYAADKHSKVESGLKNTHTQGTEPLKEGLIEHLVILPDRPNVLARRVEIRPRHSPNFLRLHNEGYVSWAGPLFHDHVDAEIARRLFKGSAMVVNEQSWRGFKRTIESDPYVRERIWDLEKTQFIPFRTLMRVDVGKQAG